MLSYISLFTFDSWFRLTSETKCCLIYKLELGQTTYSLDSSLDTDLITPTAVYSLLPRVFFRFQGFLHREKNIILNTNDLQVYITVYTIKGFRNKKD